MCDFRRSCCWPDGRTRLRFIVLSLFRPTLTFVLCMLQAKRSKALLCSSCQLLLAEITTAVALFRLQAKETWFEAGAWLP